LPVRQLGPLSVSAIGLGCMNLSHAYGVPPSPEDGTKLLNRALDLGITFLDTAALYGGGDNERLIGSGNASPQRVHAGEQMRARHA
jgi:aryl-alcohol dehydrogenase-like predicted oxidoreductase